MQLRIIKWIFAFLGIIIFESSGYAAENITLKSVVGSQAFDVNENMAPRRIALIIGNSDYKYVGRLENPANDAKLIAESVKNAGFKLYGDKAHLDLDRDTMLSIIDDFGDHISNDDVAFFFYAGHGIQAKGENYLIPVNANIKSEFEVRVKGVEVELLFAKLAGARNSVNIVVLDACRNNPFARSFRSTESGLALVTAPSGTIVAFSTAPGHIAQDGPNGNSIYSGQLAYTIKQPGLNIEEIFKQVRLHVKNVTNGAQVPWENTSLIGNFYFVEDTNRLSREKYELLRMEKEDLELRLKQSEEMTLKERRAREAMEKQLEVKSSKQKTPPKIVSSEDEVNYRKQYEQNRSDKEIQNALVSYYVKNKKYNDLLVILKEGVEIDPKDQNGHYKLGLVNEYLKNFEEAITSYKKAIDIDNNHAKALNAMGRVYLKIGKIKEAKESLNAAIKVDPNLEEATVLLSNIQDELPKETEKAKVKKTKKKKSSQKQDSKVAGN